LSGKVNPKGLFSPQESDYLQRYYRLQDGVSSHRRKDDASLKSDIAEKVRSNIARSMEMSLLESVMLRSYLSKNSDSEIDLISRHVGEVEEKDGLVSEYVKAWVPENQFRTFMEQLLLPDPFYPNTLSMDRLQIILNVTERMLLEFPLGDGDGDLEEKVIESVNKLTEDLSQLSDLLGSVRGGSYDSTQHPDDMIGSDSTDLQAALDWITCEDKAKYLTGSVEVPGHIDGLIRIDWRFNIPAMLLIHLSRGLLRGEGHGTALSLKHPERASWSDITDIIIKCFERYDLAIISKEEWSGHPDRYYLDPLESIENLDNKDLEDAAHREWRVQFEDFPSTSPLVVIHLGDLISHWKSMIENPSRSGGKKSALSTTIDRMIELGLVVENASHKRGRVSITPLGKMVAANLKGYDASTCDDVVTKGINVHAPS